MPADRVLADGLINSLVSKEDLIPIETPTGMHRYVKRSEAREVSTGILSAEGRTLRIHQMEWRVIDFTTGSNGVEHFEWRDVPLVEETKIEAIMATVYKRRRQGLPDYEKPPLGQPPAFLQEQEPSYGPSDRGDWDPAARLNRVDTSLAKQLQTSMEKNAAMAGIIARLKEHLELAVAERDALKAQLSERKL